MAELGLGAYRFLGPRGPGSSPTDVVRPTPWGSTITAGWSTS